MGERCGTEPTLEELEAEYERARQDRIDRYYQGESAADMAERIVDLEDELGSDVDGMCTGMHADVAEAHCEIERLTRALRLSEAKVGGAKLYVDQVNARSAMLENVVTVYDGIHGERDRYRAAWSSARRRAARAYGAWRHATASESAAYEELAKQDDFAQTLWEWLKVRRKQRDRYRLAWLSARRRAADEANLGAEAVEHLAADRDRWQRGHERAEAQLVPTRSRLADVEARLDAVRTYALERCTDDGANIASASWVLHLLGDDLRESTHGASMESVGESTHGASMESVGEVDGETVWRLKSAEDS